MKFKIKKLNKKFDPFNVYKLFKDQKNSIFLDSSKEDEKLSKYSFIGINPICKYEVRDNCTFVNGIKKEGNPFNILSDLVNRFNVEINDELPFVAGAIGYFSYSMRKYCEEIKEDTISLVTVPDSIFVFYENIIIFDLINDITYISAISDNPDNSIYKIEERLVNNIEDDDVEFKNRNTIFHSNFSKNEYIEAIKKIKDYIVSGDVYIANMTRHIWCDNFDDSFSIYKRLRKINKAPFSAYMNFDDFQIISSSPERFISIKDNKVVTSPIKGTTPRGKDKKEDEFYRNKLINSEKDKSELLMVVDLERNDLSKVCKPHSVKVTELFKIEEYATVFHLVSTVVGELDYNIDSVKCIKECFPGGSITGTPKIRTMEVISEVEKIDRNIYTGSIGYLDLRGNCDFNIIIRTILKKDNKAYFGVGGGITIESNEEDEWYETIDKAKALMKVL